MTIKTRNRIIILLMIISLSLILGTGIITGLFYFSHSIVPPSEINYTVLQNNVVTRYSFTSVIVSILLFLVYTTAALFYINVEFEKTQASEIVYLALFLTGCLTESFRLCVPLLNLWNSISFFTVFCSRIVIFGRVLCITSILMTAIGSAPERRQYVEQNTLMTIGASLVIAILLPVNTCEMLPTGIFNWGMRREIVICMCTLLFIACLSQHLMNLQSTNRNNLLLTGMLLLCAGYVVLCSTINWLMAGFGFALLVSGTFIYLNALHKQYLWT